MKRTIAAILFLISTTAIAQQKPRQDTVTLKLTLPEIQFIYQAIDAQHGDHQAIRKLLDYIADETNKLVTAKSDSANKKKP